MNDKIQAKLSKHAPKYESKVKKHPSVTTPKSTKTLSYFLTFITFKPAKESKMIPP